LLIDAINRAEIKLPQVCYHRSLADSDCDTCMVEVEGKLVGPVLDECVRRNARINEIIRPMPAAPGFDESSKIICSVAPSATTTTATAPFNNTRKMLGSSTRKSRSSPSRRGGQHQPLLSLTIRANVFSVAVRRGVPDVPVNETLSINWKMNTARGVDGGSTIGNSSCAPAAIASPSAL